MADLGTFKVRSKKLRQAAEIWRQCAGDTGKVASDISPAVGQGDEFGVLAGSSGVSGNYDIWVEAMHTACLDASKNFAYLDAALNSAANAYDGADNTTATSMRTLDGMI